MAAYPPKLIVTLGPATRAEESLRKIKDKGVDFIRINMSHSSIEICRTSSLLRGFSNCRSS